MYDSIFESLEERVLNGEITLEFAEAVNDLAYERFIYEQGDDVTENTKEDIKKCKKLISELKVTLKSLRRLIRDSQIRESRTTLNKAKSILTELEQTVNKLPDKIPNNVLENLLTGLGAAATVLAVGNFIMADKNMQNENDEQAVKYLSRSGQSFRAITPISYTRGAVWISRRQPVAYKREVSKVINSYKKELEKIETRLSKLESAVMTTNTKDYERLLN